MKPSSAKAKGRKHQQATASAIQDAFGLSPRDVVSTPMGSPGADVKLSEVAYNLLPVAVECKAVATFIGHTYLDQAASHAAKDGGYPLAVVRANHKQPIVLMGLEDFLNLLIWVGHAN